MPSREISNREVYRQKALHCLQTAAPKPERGRPCEFTEALADRICERLAARESLHKICQSPDMPARPTMTNWTLDNGGGGFMR
jgi:hypothetical protein